MTDGRTDGQTDESDFIGRCPANVERPIKKLKTTLGIIILERTQKFPEKLTFLTP